MGTPATSATDFDAGYLLEINFRLDETYNFVSGLNVPYSIKEGNTSDAGSHIQAEVQALVVREDQRVGVANAALAAEAAERL